MIRRALPLILLSLALCAGSALAETVAGLPLHVQRLASGAIRLWIGDHISSTAVVAIPTGKGILVIDTTGFPEVDRQLRAVIARELGRDDFAYLINTHEHRDHVGGNAVYADCAIVGHELVAAGMNAALADRPRIIEWQTRRIAELETEIAALAAEAPEKARLQEELIIHRLLLEVQSSDQAPVPPTQTFADRLVLDLGDAHAELYYIGGMHSASDIAVLVPEHGLLLTGDTMADVWLTDTPGCLASFSARAGVRHDFPCWLRNWNALLARRDEIKTLLPGHWNGELSLAGAAARVAYIETLWEAATRTHAAGGRVEDLLAEYRLADRFPDLANSPGFLEHTNRATLFEIWICASGQRSAAQALYALIESGSDEAALREIIDQRSADSPAYYFLEAEINGFGYRFLQAGRNAQAVALLRINVELFPASWNVYDSLGEALLAAGDREGAAAMYEKSLEVNPENTNGRTALEGIRRGAS